MGIVETELQNVTNIGEKCIKCFKHFYRGIKAGLSICSDISQVERRGEMATNCEVMTKLGQN